MCLNVGNDSKRRYEDISRPSRPVDPVYRASRYENPRRAPMVPPNPQRRKTSERQVKEALRDADKIASNRRDKLFATSDRHADGIRELALAKARQNTKARAPAPPPPPPRPAAQHQASFTSSSFSESDSDSHESAQVAPLIIKKDTPPPPQKHQRAVRPAELGNTVPMRRAPHPPAVDERNIHPALRSSGKVYGGQDDIHPAYRAAFKPRDLRRPQPTPQTSTRQVEQSRIHPALKTTEVLHVELRSSLHPAFRNLPDDEAHPRHHASGSRKHAVEREVHAYLGKPHNYAHSPRESEVSMLNVTHKLPYAAPHGRR